MTVDYVKKDKIAYITLNRPEARNALDPDTLEQLGKTWMDFRDDASVLVAIITGVGNSFCAGADLGTLIPRITASPEGLPGLIKGEMAQIFQSALLRHFDIWKPIVAAVNGYCIAGGLEMLLGMDIRIASENAFFAIQEPRWGLFPAGGSTVRLPRQVPFCKAMEILLTGEKIDANEAYRMGLVNYVVPQAELMPTAEKFARRIADNGPLAVSAIKKSAIECLSMPLPKAYEHEIELATPVFKSEDAIEGPLAFMQKRKPDFKGK
ncbi:MAG: crotonase/enoyl-CoA hydratase family protein [Candidatus Abyssobacteria bacterium SURF_17]|uniref:Crotonase/enoyl-CoA hydratase family protein n=1 Tax=Candidatus Abyssobacteria bacterium SURF_17 TaxID=2093361 RepID=A0A419EV94_9BACT|nr:MAG: crotonase/enoyl-CoA hydratase family protein [Candidatus Abyssubacteria bacterium SURF_17]